MDNSTIIFLKSKRNENARVLTFFRGLSWKKLLQLRHTLHQGIGMPWRLDWVSSQLLYRYVFLTNKKTLFKYKKTEVILIKVNEVRNERLSEN